MTTYIADGYGAGCDSLWSDEDGNPVLNIPIRKYLWFDGRMINGQLSRQILLLYSGDYYSLLNHQAYYLDLISREAYQQNLIYLEALGWNRISLIEIDVELFPFGFLTLLAPEFDWGIYYGGSGGRLAAGFYAESHRIRPSIQHAIDLDPRTGGDINSLFFSSDGELDLQGFQPVDMARCGIIKSEAELMAIGLPEKQASGGSMKYSGCSTSPAVEAKQVSAKEMIEIEEKRRKQRRIVVTPEGAVRRKRVIRQVTSA